MLDIPLHYYFISFVVGIVIGRVWRWEGGLLAWYIVFLLAQTVLIRGITPEPHFQQELFWSWKAWKTQRNQILTNVVMFIPVGVLAGLIWRWRGLLIAIGLSMGIEVLQLISQCGLCEFDDVLHNSLGAAIGIGIVMIIRILGDVDEGNRKNH